jgi:hypothetical protein
MIGKLILARDLLSHQPPPALAARIHQALYGTSPAMGDRLSLLEQDQRLGACPT